MKAKVVSLVTMKGGSGKSTTAMCLAGAWQSAGHRVGLIDADPAATVLRWRETGDDFGDIPARSVDGADVGEAVAAFASDGIDRVVVDTPGFRSAALDAAVLASNLVLIPLRPSPVDFQVAADTAEVISGLGAASSVPAVRFLLTQTNKSSVIARHMRAELEQAGYDLMESQLGNRVAYGEAALAGSTPTFFQPRGAAAREITDLADEVDRLLAGKRRTSTKTSTKTRSRKR